MNEPSETLKTKINAQLAAASSVAELERIYTQFLGRKGELTALLRELKDLAVVQKIAQGQQLNELKVWLQQQLETREQQLEQQAFSQKEQHEWLDVTAPGQLVSRGHLHPLTQVSQRASEIFSSMGFQLAQGPEIEPEFYNFDALNIPADHSSRDIWDTFWLADMQVDDTKTRANVRMNDTNKKTGQDKLLLRTHTSPVQVRYMQAHQPPLRIIAPGRCFRHEATDAAHDVQFYQLEGLMVDKSVSVANLKALIEQFYSAFFGQELVTRFRPSYFPFTEPSFEVDLKCVNCEGSGCPSCKNSGWLEMMGAGLVHPQVFKAAGLIASEWQGFAFGMGLDRLAMMKYRINDIRLFYNGDLRFINQF